MLTRAPPLRAAAPLNRSGSAERFHSPQRARLAPPQEVPATQEGTPLAHSRCSRRRRRRMCVAFARLELMWPESAPRRRSSLFVIIPELSHKAAREFSFSFLPPFTSIFAAFFISSSSSRRCGPRRRYIHARHAHAYTRWRKAASSVLGSNIYRRKTQGMAEIA